MVERIDHAGAIKRAKGRKEQNFICLKVDRPLMEPRGGEHFFGSHIIIQPDDHFKADVAITRAYQSEGPEGNWHGSTLRFNRLEAYAVLEGLLKFFQSGKAKDKITVWTPHDLDKKAIKQKIINGIAIVKVGEIRGKTASR